MALRPTSSRLTFALKALAAALLVAAADWLFFNQRIGATLGGFALVWCGALVTAVPALRRGAAASALALAAAMAGVLAWSPSLLGWSLFWAALSSAALLPRQRFDHAAGWAGRLLAYGGVGLIMPARDAAALARRPTRGRAGIRSLVRALALPVLGGGLFLALFASANPVIDAALGWIALPPFWTLVLHLGFWAAVLALVWPSFRPGPIRWAPGPTGGVPFADLPPGTLILSLATFNAVFALQNGLDLVILWSGAALPAGVTLASYAHQGAYTLIVTALLAGAFVLVALAPDSRAARSPAVRKLLVLWLAQNVLLVASSILRLCDYIAAFSLTEWRISALAWMALVATGLVLIGWRLLAARSAAWLINANALAAALVLVLADVVDLGAVAARWNVDHARHAEQLDLCYLHRLGPAALLPLIDLERRAGGPILRDRARYLRREIEADLAARQADWHGWTWQGAWRLQAARALAGRADLPLRPAPNGRGCDGVRFAPPPPDPPATPAPLTPGVQR